MGWLLCETDFYWQWAEKGHQRLVLEMDGDRFALAENELAFLISKASRGVSSNVRLNPGPVSGSIRFMRAPSEAIRPFLS